MTVPALPIEVLAVVAAAMVAVHAIGVLALRRTVSGSTHPLGRSILEHSVAPLQAVLPLSGLEITLTAVSLPGTLRAILLHVFGVALIIACAWLTVRLSYVIDDMILGRYRLDVENNLHARQVHTQIQVLRRVTAVVVGVIALSLVLLSFPEVRTAGAGLLASAGLVGVVAGIAAKPAATNVVAGLQIAASQPIRVDDVVVVEGHWGRIEQIALTYVVVRVWDLRRLVLPISYFIENPFENWTRSSADILGWIHLEVDYTTPVEALRAQLLEIAKASPDWDGKVCILQVTGLGTETMQLRALVSSADSSRSWNLQCEVRERMIGFLQRVYPRALPRKRAEIDLGQEPTARPPTSSPRARAKASPAADGDSPGRLRSRRPT
ncbi:MAG: mechanosensitive ion channel family protein [Candidatus Dormibacteria bacterium]